MSEYTLIHIVGGIGAGKTTLLDSMKVPEGYTILREPVQENPLLELFYANPKRYIFPMEVFMEHYFCRGLKGNIITDYGVPEVFVNLALKTGLLSKVEHTALLDMIHTLEDDALENYNRIFVFLDTSPEECLRRIKKRGRPCEAGIIIDTCRGLQEEYKKYLATCSSKLVGDSFCPSSLEFLF